jgi:hypothetical protein
MKLLLLTEIGFSPSDRSPTLVQTKLKITPFIHSVIIHSINPYKVDKPTGYRICHDTNCIRTI